MRFSTYVAALFVCAGLALSIFVFRDMLVRYVWAQFHISAPVAIMQVPNAELYFEIAEFYFNGESYNLEKAAYYYQKVLEADSKYNFARYQLSRIHFIEGEFEQARSMLDMYLAQEPHEKRAYYIRGLVNGFDGRWEEAEQDFKTFIAWAPDEWAGYADLAWVYFATEAYEKSSDIAAGGLEKHPENPWLLNAYGVALLNLERFTEAQEVLEKALEHSLALSSEEWGQAYPGNNKASYSRGLESMRKGISRNLDLAYDRSSL